MTQYKVEIKNPKVEIGEGVKIKFIDATGRVYCKNCKYWKEWRWDGHYNTTFREEHCSFLKPIKNERESDIIGKFSGYEMKVYFQTTNKDNKCPHYKRKWWKFWIKD